MVVAVFARPATPGACKTRLIPALGEVGAARLAAAMLEDTLATCASLPWADPVVASTEPGEGVWEQGDGDLGARIERILRRAMGPDGAIALGADSPGLPASALDMARAALREHDAVIGPATDGGFYLLGLRHCPEGLLADLPWSDPDTGSATWLRLLETGCSVAMLPEWLDVDVPDDLHALRRLLHANPAAAPHTRAALAALGQL